MSGSDSMSTHLVPLFLYVIHRGVLLLLGKISLALHASILTQNTQLYFIESTLTFIFILHRKRYVMPRSQNILLFSIIIGLYEFSFEFLF